MCLFITLSMKRFFGVVVFEIAIVTAVEIDDDRHDLAQAQLTLAHTLALATLEQALGVARLKDLAKVVDIAEHGNELAHRDLRMIRAASWSIQLP
jgi:hypothetical protein